jgi:hypothetical protein
MPSGNIKNLITMDRQTGTPSVATVLCLILSIFSNLNTCENNQNTRDVPIHKDLMSNDIKSSTMCERTTSICVESIYEDVLKYQLKLNNEFQIVTNKQIKKSNKGKVNNSQLTHTF